MKKLILFFCFTTISFISAQTEVPKAEDWNWVKYENNPVLKPSLGGKWDAAATYMPCVLKIDGTYHMWYAGINSDWSSAQIGYASSSDGKNWTKYSGNPVLTPGGEGTWANEQLLAGPEVYYDGENFHMWYYGFSGNLAGGIGYAYSPDGINWTKYKDNPVITPGEGVVWDNFLVSMPSVIREEDQYRMWFCGGSSYRSQNFGTATSSDGMSWEKFIDPIMESNEGEVALWQPEVIKWPDGSYYMWYTEGPWGSERLDLRFAYSDDGLSWINANNNVAISRGENEDWDRLLLGFASILYDEDQDIFQMWYFASDEDDNYRIGYAEADVPTDVVSLDILPDEYSLSQNYPNPFNPVTRIEYSIPRDERRETKNVKIIVFDLLGREVITLVNENQKPGNYEVIWDGSMRPSGVYFYKIKVNEFSQVKKMMLLK